MNDLESAMDTKLRVLIVAPSLDILGGQSVQAARLLDHLVKEPRLQVGFVPINPRLPGVLRRLQSIKYVRTILTSIAYVASLLLTVPRYDVLHVFSASYVSFVLAPTPAILIAKLYRRKVLLNYHSGEAEDHLRRWRSAILTLRLADSIIVPSTYLVRVFASFGLQTTSIFNIIETDRFRYRDRVPLKPVFLSNRNLERHYGVDTVLRAFAKCQRTVPHARLIVAGDGSQSAALKRLAQELELKNTAFIGRIDPACIDDIYDQADIYLNGSKIDNQPLSLIEAFSAGLPVVTTDAGGIPDMVHDGITGMVVPCSAEDEMALRALTLLSDAAITRQLIDNARKECLKYRWEAVRGAWIGAYFGLANKHENKGRTEPSPERRAARK